MVEPDWAALEDLDDNQLAATLLEYLDAVMAGRSVEAEDALLAVLPWPLQALWLLSWLEFEVTQGSLLAYFFNSAGRLPRSPWPPCTTSGPGAWSRC